MLPRERMLAAINHQPVDRIPTDIWATPEVWAKLRQHFGPGVDIYDALHIDGIIGIGAKYVGPTLPEVPPGHEVNPWGMRFKPVDYGTGSYMEQYHHPLAEAKTIDDLNAYHWRPADWFDYSGIAPKAAEMRQKRLVQCGYMAPFYFHNQLRGLERSLMDPYDDPEFTHHLLNRIADSLLRFHRKQFEAAAGLVDVAQVTDDYGSQTGPLMSMKTFREFYKPHMQRMIDLCREFGIRIFHHDDGAIRPFLPDFIDMGIEILNPIQHTCPGMEMAGLKRDFGKKLCFHGGIDNQQTLPFGTPDQVRQAVRQAIDTLASDGTGYILAPCHNLQNVSPMENILAMYDEAQRYGVRG
jgi:uroporphyrinogen decarboxylase